MNNEQAKHLLGDKITRSNPVLVMPISEYEKILGESLFDIKALSKKEINQRVHEILLDGTIEYDPSLLIIIHDDIVELF